ncbi:MAG: hypothetical protein ABJB69_09145 [Spartobacteria bacterium]
MTTHRLSVILAAIALIAGPVAIHGAKPAPEATPIDVPLPKGAQHIVINAGDNELKQVFTYFPYPPLPTDTRGRVNSLRRSGTYRIEVNPDGSVGAVTILKSMGRSMDFGNMKAFAKWKGKPGGLRAVDVTFTLQVFGRSFNGRSR